MKKVFQLDGFIKRGRKYWYEVDGRWGYKARYVKEVDRLEETLKFYQEIYNENGILAEVHEKYPINKGIVNKEAVMLVTKDSLTKMIADYLNRRITKDELVDWAENMIWSR